jgi:GAF domain-containing protein
VSDFSLQSDQEQVDILSRILAIGQALQRDAIASPKKVYQLIVETARELTGADCVVIYPYHPAFGKFYDVENVTATGLHHRLRLKERPAEEKGLTARLHQEGEVIIEEIGLEKPEIRSERVFVTREGIEALMGLSLKVGDNVVGAFYVDYRQTHGFSEGEKKTIRLLGQQAAMAISTSWTSQLARIRTETIANLKTVGQKLIDIEDPSRTLDEQLGRVARGAQEVLDADMVDLYQYVQSRSEFILPPILVGKRRHPDLIPTTIYHDDVVIRALEIGEPQYFDNAQATPWLISNFETSREAAPTQRFVVREGVASSAIIPLKTAHETMGLMFVNYRRHQEFGLEQRDVIESFAAQAAIAIHNARLFRSEREQRRIEQRRNRHLSVLNRSATNLSRILDAEQVCQAIVEAVVDTLESDYCTVFVAETDSRLVSHTSGGRLFVEAPKLNFAPGEGLAGWVYQKGESLIINNTAEEPRYKLAPWEREVKARSMILSPLRQGKKIIGVVSADIDRTEAFDDKDLQLLDTLTSHSGTVLENIEFFKDFQILHDAANNLAKQPALDQIYHLAVQSALKTLHCNHSTIFSFDKRIGELVAMARVGSPQDASEVSHFKPGQGLAGTVVQTGEPILLKDAARDKRFIEGKVTPRSAPRSMVLAPIKIEDQVIGVLSADKDEKDGFTDHNLEMLATLALDVGIAINLRRQQDMLHAIAEFQRAISEILPIEALLEQIFEKMSGLMDASSMFIALYDEDANTIRFPLAYERGQLIDDQAKGEGRPYSPRAYGTHRGLTEWVIRHKEPLLVEDLDTWATAEKEIDEQFHQETQCCLLAPALIGNNVIGVIGLQNFDQTAVFDSIERDLLVTIAGQAAIAIHNSRQFNESLHRIEALDALNQVGQTLTADIRLRQDEILKLIYEQARKLAGAENIYIALYEEETDTVSFNLVMERGQAIDAVQRPGFLPRTVNTDSRGKTEEIILTQKPILHRTRAEEVAWYQEPGHRQYVGQASASHLAIPMVIGKRVIGVIAVYDWEREYAYDEQDLQVLSVMASQAAIALENARQYDLINNQLARRIAELEAISKFQHQISDIDTVEQEIEEIYNAAAKAMSGLMDTRNMHIALYDEASGTIEFPLAYEKGRRVPDREKVAGKPWGPRRLGEYKRLTEWVIRHKKPLLIEKDFAVRLETVEGVEPFPTRGTKCWLGAPMLLRDMVIGVIGLQNFEQAEMFDPSHRDLLMTIAGQAAVALENAQLYDQLDLRIKELRAVSEFQQQISEIGPVEQELEKIYEKAAKAMLGIMDTRNMYIAIYDENRGTIEFPLAYQEGSLVPDEKKVEETPYGPRSLGDRKGLTEWLIRHKKPLLIAKNFDAWIEAHDEIEAFSMGTKCWLGAPMLLRDRVIGVIGLQNLEEEEVFDRNHQDLLVMIASQAAIAIDNASILERRMAELKAISLFQQKIISIGSEKATQ